MTWRCHGQRTGKESARDTANTHTGRVVSAPEVAFRDRGEAGLALTDFVAPEPDPDALVLAVPRGGVPVAEPLAGALEAPLDIAPVRKLPIPDSPEAGFGAVAVDGSSVLNEDLVIGYRLRKELIERIRKDVLSEVRRRALAYRGHDKPPVCLDKHVYLVDDGLASGYTMLAALEMARNAGAANINVCVPVSPVSSIELIKGRVDGVYCLIAQRRAGFAVASFYQDFGDLTDAQVRRVTERNGTWNTERWDGPA